MTTIDKRGGRFTLHASARLDLKIALRFVNNGSAIDITGQTIRARVSFQEDSETPKENVYTGVITNAGDGRATVTIPKTYYNSLPDNGFDQTFGCTISRENATEEVAQIAGSIVLTGANEGGGSGSSDLVTITVTDTQTIEIGASDGLAGNAATIAVGTTTGLASGATPTVANSGTSSAAVFDFGIPVADDGAAATVSVGTVTTLTPGSSATVTNSGSSSAAVLDFGLPSGNDGLGTGTVTSVAISGSNGISFSGSPITSSGTFTMSINAAALRTHLNVEDGADVTDATNVAAAGALMESDFTADGEFLVGTGSGTFAVESGATVRTSLGLGSIATLAETTTAEYRNNTADRALSTDQVWAAGAEVTLTDAATISVDMNTFINATVTLAGNRTLGNPTNEKVGQTGCIRVVQDATGTRTLAFGSDYEFAGGTAPTLSTAANAEDLLFYHVLASNRVFVSSALAVS